MNVFEKCLLIQWLISKDENQKAEELAASIEALDKPLSVNEMNRIYDVVLNMNSLNSKPKGEGKCLTRRIFMFLHNVC